MGPGILTLGHSDRTLPAFLRLLRAARVDLILDVRSRPGSRRHPHFARAALTEALAEVGIGYRWEGEALGGRRRGGGARHSLLSPPWRPYAAWMEGDLFRAGALRVLDLARTERVALLCAERFPGDCHRRLVADWIVVVAGRGVEHWIEPDHRFVHRPDPAARRDGERLVYDGGLGHQATFDFLAGDPP